MILHILPHSLLDRRADNFEEAWRVKGRSECLSQVQIGEHGDGIDCAEWHADSNYTQMEPVLGKHHKKETREYTSD